MRVRALFGLAMIVGCMGAASRGEDAPVDASIAIDAGQPGIELSETMWGLFFEEINFAGDGGIYAELVRQRDFEGERPLQHGVAGRLDDKGFVSCPWPVLRRHRSSMIGMDSALFAAL